ncbi:TP53-regulated inhibitor of apoptosis 1-like [Ylistrum balloti]|uniref:TP53-regulated inhibitor of apoptosis 1-like n=1 Tax=Ylistrum balloti TaxID=509963 RepID=UPI0029059BE1|nr:TP53-regulated inhibitor of apoptosis 1-like [Ylistrum balloti]
MENENITDSISEDCLELKRAYDKCFNKWFPEEFLRGSKKDSCAPIFKEYQACVKKAAKAIDLDLGELEEDVLGTNKEKKTSNEDLKGKEKS